MVNVYAQQPSKANLPEGAKLRIGKGTLGEIAYFPDGTRFAVATSVGIWVYDSITGKELYQLTDHTNGINIIRFSPDGNVIATESQDESIHMWDTNTGNHLYTVSDSEFGLYDPVFSPNGKIITVQCAEKFTYFRKTVRLYDVKTGKHLNTISDNTHQIHNIRFSPDSKMFAMWGYRQIRLWNTSTGQLLRTVNDPCETFHDNKIKDVQFSPDRKKIFVLSSIYYSRESRGSSWTGNVGIVNFRNIGSMEWKQLERKRHALDDEGFSSLSFSPDGNTLATIHKSDGNVELWDINTGDHINPLIGKDIGRIDTLSFSSNGRLIATGGRDGTIHLWAAKQGMHLIPLSGHKSQIKNIVISPDGMTILSEDTDNTVNLWNAITGQLLKTFDGYTESVYDVALTPDGNTIASWSSDKALRLYDINTGKLHKQYNLNEQHKLNGIKGYVSTIYFPLNGNTFITQSIWSHLCLWHVNTGELIIRMSERDNYIEQVHISPNRKTIAGLTSDNTIMVWDVNTGLVVKTISGVKGKLYQIGYSTDGSVIVSNSSENTTQLWDTNTGELIRTLSGISGGINALYYSKDGSTILTSIYEEDYGDGAFLWDGMTGQHIRDLSYSGATSFVSASPNGKIIAIVDGHGSVVDLFDISKRQHLRSLAGHVSLESCGGGTISDVQFSYNGKRIVTASSVDATAIIWNANSGERLKTLSGHTGGISSVAFSSDGKTLASGSSDGTILLWEVE